MVLLADFLYSYIFTFAGLHFVRFRSAAFQDKKASKYISQNQEKAGKACSGLQENQNPVCLLGFTKRYEHDRANVTNFIYHDRYKILFRHCIFYGMK